MYYSFQIYIKFKTKIFEKILRKIVNFKYTPITYILNIIFYGTEEISEIL